MRRVLVLVPALVVACSAAFSAQSRTLDIYWIDVEGGAATLVVTPSGESMLVDTGFETGGRDAKRIFAAAQKAGLKQLDHVVISHYHGEQGSLIIPPQVRKRQRRAVSVPPRRP